MKGDKLSSIIFLAAFLSFFGHGDTTCDVTRKLKQGPKSALAQQFMNCWGANVEHGKVDLVILMDRSASMETSGFAAAKTFIKSLLTEVKVAFSATRIAVVSFAWKSKIDINYLWEPKRSYHKCKFVEDFKKVKFTRGLTNLKGALEDAHTIFGNLINQPVINKNRPSANKVIMLLSDGKGNIDKNGKVNIFVGNDVNDEITKIRKFQNVEVYTVAVTEKSDNNTLKNIIATDPRMFMYQPDFNSLKDISRLIRGDAYEHDYELTPEDESECKEGCDANADCGCNLLSGNYKCACSMGYFGTGEKKQSGRSCEECAVDTYGSKVGMLTSCSKCPANSGTRGLKKQKRRSDCHCNIGHDGNPGQYQQCKKKACNGVPYVENGFVANKIECNKNVFGARCIFRCKINFKLVGNDIVQCDENQKWVGEKPKCETISCPAAEVRATSNNYTVRCHSPEFLKGNQERVYPFGTNCTYVCNDKLYHDSGSKVRHCLETGKWNGTTIECRERSCPKVPKNDEKVSINSSVDCFTNSIKVGQKCNFSCPSGYQLIGPKIMTCKQGVGAIGKWDPADRSVSCKDNERPNFSDNDGCLNGIALTNTTLPGESYGLINFEAIGVTDNSGGPIVLTSDPPGNELGHTYRFEITQDKLITFTASDASGNKRVCRFKISILDKEPPKYDKCPEDKVVITEQERTQVDWVVPTYTDNCGTNCFVQVTSNWKPSNSLFRIGKEEEVRYNATDPSSNQNVDCVFRVKVTAPTCGPLTPPKHGMLTFHKYSIATASCQYGRKPAKPFAFLYTCQAHGWGSFPPSQGKLKIPDCIPTTPPTGADLVAYLMYTYKGSCDSEAAQQQAKTNFLNSGFCSLCTIDSMESYCGATTVVNRRRRSTTKQLTLKVTIKVTTTKEEAVKDPSARQLRTKMATAAPKFLADVRSVNDWNKRVDSNIRSLVNSYTVNTPKMTCADVGDVFYPNAKPEEQCAPCQTGEFKNLTTGSCQTCPHGTYQPNEGSTSCITCPEGSTTIGNDVKNLTSCRKICGPGEFSENGLSHCTPSPPGTYTEGYRQTSSKPCPAGTTTITSGASSRFACGTRCHPGTYSKTGVEPCTPCERGTYQSLSGRFNCIDCPALTWTYGEGANSIAVCTDINSCASNPCLSGGHCIDLKLGFRCECKPGYWGTRCEKEVNDCALKPCLNGGKCLDKFGGYMCVCPDGARGKNCEQLIGICKSGICGLNGDCTDLSDNTFQCVCNDGYTGKFCETFIDPCQSQPCKNEAVCLSASSDFNCQCKPGFTGKTCETNLNFCADEPCLNGGECSDGRYGFSCQCKTPYHGVRCELKTNMCQHTVCKHSVSCTDLGHDVKCSCKPGYGGKLCDNKLSSDFDIGFQTRQTPSFSFVEGKFDLTQFTAAFWMRTSDTYNQGTPISYANKDKGKINDNALVLSDYGNFELTVNNISTALNFDANDGEWHHIAVTWSSSTGQWIAYKDGSEVKRSETAFQKGQTIRKGGVFVVGEEQDEIGGAFATTESFFGDLSQLNIWRSVLSPDRIYDLAMSCKHGAGDVLAWADFSEQSHGSIVKIQPSTACDFTSALREYQQLDGWQLPVGLRSVISTASQVNPKSCAQSCSSGSLAQRCRSFIYDKNLRKCTFYSKSLLIDEQDPVKADQYELYQYSCVKPLGMEDGRIPNSRITASSILQGTQPYMARLHNVPTSSSKFAHWSPAWVGWTFIQIDLQSEHKITAIATQGHWDETVNEYASTYLLYYKDPASVWKYSTKVQANTDSKNIVRREMMFHATAIKMYPFKKPDVARVSLRLEIYGCPAIPQGKPNPRSDANQCAGSPCLNGGQCVDLYQRYVCICPDGYVGSRCEQVESCPSPDVPVYGSLISKSASRAEVRCNAGYSMTGNAVRNCVKGKWDGSPPTCSSSNECAAKLCSHGCQDLEGGYRCYCPEGYNLGSDRRTCQEINECSTNNGGCTHICINTDGGYRCSCRHGYQQIGKLLCMDVDECKGNHGCSQDCDNTLGSYKCSCKTGYHLNSNGKTCDQTRCPSVPNIAYGIVSRSTFKVTYRCNAGYKISGPSMRKCYQDGKWSGVQPTCTRVTCSRLGGETAIVSVSGNNFGAVARFSCKPLYRLIGSTTRTCTQSSEWSNSQPRCASSSCPALSNPLNGKILGLGTTVASVIRVKCNQGYKLVQNNLELRTCQSNGQWTGGNTAAITCKIIDCGAPATSSYLQITTHGNTYYQARATYSCSQSGGQRCLDGPSTRHCNADGKWSGKEPRCVANSCCKPKVPENSKFYSDNRYNYGDKVYTKCDTGYVAGGTALRTCQNNGQWSGTQSTCTIADCGDPGSVTNGLKMMTTTTYQSVARYFCDPGFSLRGSSKRVCQADGTWSGQSTSCIQGGCGGNKWTKSGSIVSNGGASECHWLIQVSQGKKVSITFSTFNLGDNDQVKIYDGKKYEEFVTFTKASPPRTLTGNSHFMRVIYIGGGNAGTGFTLAFKEASCGGLLEEERGVITSPGFPVSYHANDECFWTVFRPYQRLQLSFDIFQLSQQPEDFVEIYEGPYQNSRMLLRQTFGMRSPLVDQSYRWMWVHFKVNAYQQAKGFQAHYRLYEPRTDN